MICSRKVRSVSMKGRSADVTKRTSSDRGTKSRVSSSWRRITAFVPGVSTTLIRSPSSALMKLDLPARRARHRGGSGAHGPHRTGLACIDPPGY
jgi:hypothetical protein